jgi:hypothetical protein
LKPSVSKYSFNKPLSSVSSSANRIVLCMAYP